MTWQPHIITKPTIDEIKQTIPDYEKVLVSILDVVLERYDRAPDYPFIDTKLSTLTGQDFSSREPEYRRRDVIYGWIQGRGLEALVGHAQWLPHCSLLKPEEQGKRIDRIRKIVVEVATQMEKMRARNNGRLFFCMRPDGTPLEIDDSGHLCSGRIPDGSNYSELFYSKGLLAAGSMLGNSEWGTSAVELLTKALNDIEDDRFVCDEQQFNPPRKTRRDPRQHPEGPWMIALGALALAYEKTGERQWLQRGEKFLRHLLSAHLNRGQFPGLQEYDFVEVLDERGQPWTMEGRVLSVPGHTLEFIGLGLKLLFHMQNKPEWQELVKECRRIFPPLFVHTFRLGFNSTGGGIYNSIDLISRRPVDTNMPWWALPETMRAAAELLAFATGMQERQQVLQALADCSNAFLANYINPRAHFMAYQTLDQTGQPVDIIPATPDADPGYHTGLCIIDVVGRTSGDCRKSPIG